MLEKIINNINHFAQGFGENSSKLQVLVEHLPNSSRLRKIHLRLPIDFKLHIGSVSLSSPLFPKSYAAFSVLIRI